MKDIIKELSISVACMLDELDDITRKDVEHLQNLITKLENGDWGHQPFPYPTRQEAIRDIEKGNNER
jgi:hypothetical protein